MNYYMDYEEDDGLVRRRNCPKCGRFLPVNPTEERHNFEWNGHYDYRPLGDDDYELIWVEDGPPIESVDPIWKCKCGAEWDIDTVYP